MPRLGRGPRLDFRRGCWVIRWTENGCSRERRTGTADRGEAEGVFADWLAARRERPSGQRREAAYLIADLLAEYQEEHGPEIAGAATLGYNVERLLDWWGEKTVSEITKSNAQSYAAHRRSTGISDNTIRRELSVLSAAVGHARASDRLRESPKVWMPPPGPAKERWLTRREVAHLLKAARSEPQAREHLPLFILLAVYGGARKGAILELRWSQVDLRHERIDWSAPGRRQTAKRRSKIPIRRRLLTFLRLARQRGSDLGPVLNIDGKPIGDVKKSFATACAAAGLKGVTPHTLRHTCGTWMAQAGVPMWEIAGFLGHTVQRTTELYAHHHPDFMERARDAF